MITYPLNKATAITASAPWLHGSLLSAAGPKLVGWCHQWHQEDSRKTKDDRDEDGDDVPPPPFIGPGAIKVCSYAAAA